ncbi:hypothetical protein M427DRAFT_63089, partial [Gonapodya prolifera JEL478]
PHGQGKQEAGSRHQHSCPNDGQTDSGPCTLTRGAGVPEGAVGRTEDGAGTKGGDQLSNAEFARPPHPAPPTIKKQY